METNEGRADAMGIMSEVTEAAVSMLPLDMVNALAELVDPAAVAKEMPWLAGEMTKIALGKSEISFDKRDKRFADEAWRTVPYFRALGQSYRLFEMWMERMYQSVEGSWQDKARARFAAAVITAALAPTNYLGTNPEALRKAVETGGLSLVRGVQNMLNDMARGGMPSMVDRKQFTVGKDIGATPGAVVYRDEMFELLQYSPATPKVRSIPVLMIPPQINRYYVLDLAPGRSLGGVRRQPGHPGVPWSSGGTRRARSAREWGPDDYLAAAERAPRWSRRSRAGERSTCSGCA
jgi:polyhydroxyalkanoate synthase